MIDRDSALGQDYQTDQVANPFCRDANSCWADALQRMLLPGGLDEREWLQTQSPPLSGICDIQPPHAGRG